MVETYISWHKKLAQNPYALQSIANHKLIDGIESAGHLPEIARFKASGLHVNVHNPTRFFERTLASPDFVGILEHHSHLKTACGESDPSILGFHITNGHEQPDDEIIKNTQMAVAYLEYLYGKQVIFETSTYSPADFGKENEEQIAYHSSPEFITTILENTDAGFLLDISHYYVSRFAHHMRNGTSFSYKDEFESLLEKIGDEIYQLHVNVPIGDDTVGYRDGHQPFSHGFRNENSQRMKEVLSLAMQAPNIQVVTLEMDSYGDAHDHARMHFGQVSMLEHIIHREHRTKFIQQTV
jgi:hypothetical protein